jgi:NAD(P) transhydrogenase
MRHCDLCVIGSGPGGQKAAIQAAKLGKDVVIVERMEAVGGVAINTGTIPSKAMREAVMAVTGAARIVPMTENNLVTSRESRISTLTDACRRVIRAENELVRKQLQGNDIEIMYGHGSFVDDRTVLVDGPRGTEQVFAENILIAVGTTPAKPDNIQFDKKTIITSDEVLQLKDLPRSMTIVGGGVIGTEYASMMAALGVRVTIIEGRNRLLDFIDQEIGEALQYHLRQANCTLRTGEKVVSIRPVPPTPGSRATDLMAEATLESGKTVISECLLYAIGRQGATGGLNLKAAGLEADNRGRIKVNKSYQTAKPNIYAVGDVIGFPALASTSMDQGRQAACHMFGEQHEQPENLIPYGIYSIPEISMVGWTEEALTKDGVPYECGIAQYKEIARGQLLADDVGMLKLLIHQESHALLGVHIIGTGATELVHIGQAVMAFKGTAEYFVNAVLNYPTLAECYKVAAFNGLNKLKHL